MEQTEAKEIYQMGVEALNDCDYRMAVAYFQNAAKMNYKPAIAALEKLILEGKYKNVQSKQTLSSNTESKELFEKGVDYYRGRNNTKIDYVKALDEKIVEGMEHEADHNHEEEANHEEHEGHIEESHTHEGIYDEHIWTSPKNAVLMVNAICNALLDIDADNADIYKSNADKYNQELMILDDEIRDIVTSSKRKNIVFGDRFPFRYLAEVSGKVTVYSRSPSGFVLVSIGISTLPASVKLLPSSEVLTTRLSGGNTSSSFMTIVPSVTLL